jgi:hypothetical protein
MILVYTKAPGGIEFIHERIESPYNRRKGVEHYKPLDI